MTPDGEDGGRIGGGLPEPVLRALEDFELAFGARFRLVAPPDEPGAAARILYESEDAADSIRTQAARIPVSTRDGASFELEVISAGRGDLEAIATALKGTLERSFEAAREIRFFTVELSERYEEIHLLYSISETLGSIVRMDDAARVILREVCDVMGAKRGSLWLYRDRDDSLHLTASVGEEQRFPPVRADDPDAVTSMVFREERPVIASRAPTREERERGLRGDSFLAVPIRYTPPSGDARTLGVLNLIGRRGEDRYSAADQKLLWAIASQVGSALENKRLHEESLSKERMGREMELAHDLQQKLLPAAERFDGADAAGRVAPAEQVGGDFYQLFKLPDGQVGVMLGDVSLHGFPSALIMTLTMSAAGIYAREHDSPARVLRDLDDALREELETTEMFLTVFYGVIDADRSRLVYSNAGHPHAFVVHDDGAMERLTATDPPVGFAGPGSYGEQEIRWDASTDLLLLFTDGLSDTLATTARGDGETRVLQTVEAHRHSAPERIIDKLFELTTDANPPNQGDDRTALVVRTRRG